MFFLPYVLSRIGLNEWIANNKALVCFCIDVVFLYLVLFVCELFTKGDWFITIGIPIASVGLLLPLGMLIIIRYTKINGFFKMNIACFRF